MEEERKLLEAERRKLEKEREQLAYVPESETTEKLVLRKEPAEVSDDYLYQMLARYDFYDRSRRLWRYFRQNILNTLVDNGDGTVTDKVTGLMWQKGGSKRAISKRRANFYVKKINKDKFAGYLDWRLPTIEELASLLAYVNDKGLYIDPVFESKQKRCWGSDGRPGKVIADVYDQGWIVNFFEGKVSMARWSAQYPPPNWIREINPSNYVKAVRSVK